MICDTGCHSFDACMHRILFPSSFSNNGFVDFLVKVISYCAGCEISMDVYFSNSIEEFGIISGEDLNALVNTSQSFVDVRACRVAQFPTVGQSPQRFMSKSLVDMKRVKEPHFVP